MLARIRRFFAPPVFEDEDQARAAQLLYVILLVILGASLLTFAAVLVVAGLPRGFDDAFTMLSGLVMALLVIASLSLLRRGHVRGVGIALLAMIWLMMSLWIYTATGIKSESTMLAYALIIMLSGLLLGGRAALHATGLIVLTIALAYYAELQGLIVVRPTELSIMDPFMIGLSMILIGLLLQYAINSLTRALTRARRNELAQTQANRELEGLRASLEQRVAERTRDLERRSVQLQAASEVSRAAVSILDPEELLWQVADLIRERFNLYHVGLFLLDAADGADGADGYVGVGGGRRSRAWAVYRAGAGQAHREMWEQGFRLPVGGNSMIGWCTATGQARVAQDAAADEVRASHDLLPETHSEAALPLVVRERVIGALSVQSRQLEAFDPSLVAALQTMADHVAAAVDNVRLLAESRQALEAARRAYGQLSRQAWDDMLRLRPGWGYRWARESHVPQFLEAPEMPADREMAASEPEAVGTGGGLSTGLTIPLRVREEVIGTLDFYKDDQGGEWTDRESQFLHRLIDQLGTALESAQLYEETQRRAARERLVAEVTGRIRETLDVDSVLRTAAQEARQVLGLPEVVVRLRSLDPSRRPPVGGMPVGGHGPDGGPLA